MASAKKKKDYTHTQGQEEEEGCCGEGCCDDVDLSSTCDALSLSLPKMWDAKRQGRRRRRRGICLSSSCQEKFADLSVLPGSLGT